MDAMDRFVSLENIRRYRHLASASIDPVERLLIMRLLADEEAAFKLELLRGDDASEGRSRGNRESGRA